MKLKIFIFFCIIFSSIVFADVTISHTINPDLYWGVDCIYDLKTEYDFEYSFRVSTDSNSLDGSNPTNLPDGATICEGNVVFDLFREDTSFGRNFYSEIPYPSAIDWNEGGRPLPTIPISFNNIQIDTNLYSILTTRAIFTYGTSEYTSLYSNGYRDYELPSKYYYQRKCDSTYTELDGKTAVGIVGKGNLSFEGLPTGPINIDLSVLGTSTPTFLSSTNTYPIDIRIKNLNLLGGSKHLTNGDISRTAINVYRNVDYFPYSSSVLETFTLHVKDPQIIINGMMITDADGNPEIVINPGQTKDIQLHLFLDRGSITFNITDIIVSPSGFIFTPSDPLNILIPTPPAGPGDYEYIITGQLTAPEDYTTSDISLRVFFDTELPVCNDQSGDWPVTAPITPGPDLISILTVDGIPNIYYAREGETITVDVDTINIGSMNTENSSTTRVDSDMLSLFSPITFSINPLNPGENKLNSFKFTCPTGENMDITFEGCADYFDTVNEVNENNNCGNITIVCESMPNLRVKSNATQRTIPGLGGIRIPIPIYDGPCIVNETHTLEITTYSNSICTENASWTQVILKQESTELSTSKYSVPPLPNTIDPNGLLYAPQRQPDTGRPFTDSWGTCMDTSTAISMGIPTLYYEVKHLFEYMIDAEGAYQIEACADATFRVTESNENDNCITILLSCTPPDPGNITVFCTDLEIPSGDADIGEWGVINDGPHNILTTITPTHSGSVPHSPSFLVSIENINIMGGDRYSKNTRWNCDDTSAVSTYTIFAEWEDPVNGILLNDSATCTVSCGIVWYCEDYL